MKILMTGFMPFGGEKVNPSWEAVRRVRACEGVELRKLELPVTFAGAGHDVTGAMDEFHPDAVILVGQAGGRSRVTVERAALNIADARIPDNEGAQLTDVPVDPSGPAAIFTTLPAKALVAAMQSAGVPAALSYSAGTYVCNHALYTALHHAQRHMLPTRITFIHVPFDLDQAARHSAPGIPLEDMVRALEAAVEETRRSCS